MESEYLDNVIEITTSEINRCLEEEKKVDINIYFFCGILLLEMMI